MANNRIGGKKCTISSARKIKALKSEGKNEKMPAECPGAFTGMYQKFSIGRGRNVVSGDNFSHWKAHVLAQI